jgi:hypothetical protein
VSGIHRASRIAMIGLALIALVTVLWGYTVPRGTRATADEGTGAHLFQLSVVLLVLATITYMATANWKNPKSAAPPLVIAGLALVGAFAALYYLEHSWLSAGR